MDGSNANATENRPQSSKVNENVARHPSDRQGVDEYEYQTDSIDASPSDKDGREDPEALRKTKSNATSIAESLPLYRELLFVAVICSGQLYTRECPVSMSPLTSRTLY
jgi:hypothetical protein